MVIGTVLGTKFVKQRAYFSETFHELNVYCCTVANLACAPSNSRTNGATLLLVFGRPKKELLDRLRNGPCLELFGCKGNFTALRSLADGRFRSPHVLDLFITPSAGSGLLC